MFTRPHQDRCWATRSCIGLIASLFVVTAAADADPACDDPRIGQLAPATEGEGLRVVRAAAPGVSTEDILLQLNGHRLRSCADLASAMQSAASQGLVPVLLVRRGDALQTMILHAPVSAPAPLAIPTVPPVIPTVPPAMPTVQPVAVPEPVSTPTAAVVVVPPTLQPSPLPELAARSEPDAPVVGGRDDSAALTEMVAALRAFDQRVTLPLLAAQPFDQRVKDLRQTYETLRARSPGVAAAEPIVRYYVTVAEILSYKEGTSPQKLGDERTAVMGMPRGRYVLGTYEYVGGDVVESWLDRYPFLSPSIVRKPRPAVLGPLEQSGEWKPDEAIRLLIEQARADTQTLAANNPAAAMR